MCTVYWAPESCEQYTLDELSKTINTKDLFDDGTNESVILPTSPLRQSVDSGFKRQVQRQIKVIVKDLKHAYEAWKQLQPGNQVSPKDLQGELTIRVAE